MEQVRLNKYLAQCGVCSRRDADKLIDDGAVLVNGRQAQRGMQVTEQDEIQVRGKKVHAVRRPVVLAFYKPFGVTCTERDAHAEKIISDLVKYPERVTYAGRLDKDSEGLLLLSNDGGLIQAMMKGANRHEKEYLVRVDREIGTDFTEKMAGGVFLEELQLTTRECIVEKTGKYTFRIVLTQGVNRQIKRMCRACGCRVTGLKRIRVMHVTLGDLRPGEYRELDRSDVERLYRDCGLTFPLWYRGLISGAE
ncbi:MAG TPA: 23S rRNA pseudouridine synthase F [Lachnospiraceae bacterium]|nr:23S rRNA pseudouridine synthase F [Lachnospiraceae bacterium]